MVPVVVFGTSIIAKHTLERHAHDLADQLFACGVCEGDVVAVMMRNRPAYIEIMLASNLLGSYCCSINWHFKEAEASHILVDSGAKVLFIESMFIEQIGSALQTTGLLCVIVPSDPEAAKGRRLEGAPLYEQFRDAKTPVSRPSAEPRGAMTYTSGSTGKPKGVRRIPPDPSLRAEMTRRRDAVSQAVFGLTASSRCLMAAPLYHSAPYSYTSCAAALGATIFLESRFDERRVLDLIEQEELTHLYLVPTMYQRLLSLPEALRTNRRLGSIQFVASTGSPCSPALKRQMIEWWGPVINEAYASTETGYITAIGSADALRKPGSAGRTLPYAELKILDDEGVEKKVGETGLIYAVQRAYPDFTYANHASARSAIERDGLVTLGDMGYVDDEGFLFVCDRRADMVISGGVNIYPAEIEAVINELPGVLDSAVFGIPDLEYGEALAAAVQLHPTRTMTAKEIKSHLETRIANYKIPKEITFHAELPREETGKIFKRRLRAPYWESVGRSI